MSQNLPASNFLIDDVLLEEGRIRFNVVVATDPVEAFTLQFTYSLSQIQTGTGAVLVDYTAPGTAVIPNNTLPGVLEIGGFTSVGDPGSNPDDLGLGTALTAGTTLFTVSMQLVDASTTEVALELSGSYANSDSLDSSGSPLDVSFQPTTFTLQGNAPTDNTAPVFTSGTTAAAIEENSGASQVVYTAQATDNSGTEPTYSLKAGQDAAAFSIDADTGELRLLANPDFEAQSTYSITVIATDDTGNKQAQDVVLDVINVDEAATGNITVLGTLQPGNTLQADLSSFNDPDGDIIDTTYRWQVLNGETWEDITNATLDTFSIPSNGSYTGATIRLQVKTVDALNGSSYVNSSSLTIEALIFGTQESDSIKGGNASEVLFGYEGDDSLDGGDGDDTLEGGEGADLMIGGIGSDVYYVENEDDVTTENNNSADDIDTIISSIDRTVSSNIENIILAGTLNLKATGNSLNNQMTGNPGSNNLFGGAGDDTIFGMEGDDSLLGSTGIDEMHGGPGDDVYGIDSSNDLIIENLDEGTDRVSSSANYTLPSNVEILTLSGAATIGTGNPLNNQITGNSSLPNNLYGLDGNDSLVGGNVSDSMDGGEGNDTLRGGLGADTMSGGPNDDFYYVDNSLDSVREVGTGGVDTIFSTVSWSLSTTIEHLNLLGNQDINANGNLLDNILTGNGADNNLFGGAGDDTLIGLSGNDTLAGASGNDYMIGGAGNDAYGVDSQDDVIIEYEGEGYDRVSSTIDYELPSHVEKLTLTGAAIVGTGNDLNNQIIGNNSKSNLLHGLLGNDSLDGGASADELHGGEGNDTARGGGGNDTIYGGQGIDIMYGGLGDDVFYVDHPQDSVKEGVNAGIDTTYSTVTRTLSPTLENLILIGFNAVDGTGNGLNNNISGNDQANKLYGGGGSDTLIGLDGDDTILGASGTDFMYGGTGDDIFGVDSDQDIVIELPNEGIDRISSSVSWNLESSPNVENLTLGGSKNINATGNDLDNYIIGNSRPNIITGGIGSDTIQGGDGSDTLNGGIGFDILIGGPGSDIFIFDHDIYQSDLINDFKTAADKIQISKSGYALDNLKNIIFTHDINEIVTNDIYIIYEAQSGDLFLDVDGTDGTGLLHVATLVGAPEMTSFDLIIL